MKHDFSVAARYSISILDIEDMHRLFCNASA